MTQSTPNIRAGAGNKIQMKIQAPYLGSGGIPECTLWTVFVCTVILLNLVFILIFNSNGILARSKDVDTRKVG